jgi:hypothetical protein
MSNVISQATRAESRQFDFLEGEWSAICRFPSPDGSWWRSEDETGCQIRGLGLRLVRVTEFSVASKTRRGEKHVLPLLR